jgi:hypothetical protein
MTAALRLASELATLCTYGKLHCMRAHTALLELSIACTLDVHEPNSLHLCTCWTHVKLCLACVCDAIHAVLLLTVLFNCILVPCIVYTYVHVKTKTVCKQMCLYQQEVALVP